MRKIVSRILMLLALVAANGCGNGEMFGQDPLDGYPDSVKNGLPPEMRPSKPDTSAFCKECFQILVNGEAPIGIQESKELKIVIEVILLKSQIPMVLNKFDLQFVNAADFPGARLILDKEIPLSDPKALTAEKKYTLTWTPPKGAVGVESQIRKQGNLKLFVDGATQTTTGRSFTVDVYRSFTIPEVRNIVTPAVPVKEGESYRFTAQVFDPDGIQTEPPQIAIRQTLLGGNYDVSQLFRVMAVRYDAGSKTFNYDIDLDLQNREVTKTSGYANFEMTAMNRFQRISQSKAFVFRLDTDLREPVSSLQSSILDVTRGQVSVHSFTILDPASEGEVNAVLNQQASSYPGTITLSCRTPQGVQGAWMKSCELKVTTAAAAFPQTFYFRLDVTNRVINLGEKSVSASLSLRIVEPKPAVTGESVSEPTSEPGPIGGLQ